MIYLSAKVFVNFVIVCSVYLFLLASLFIRVRVVHPVRTADGYRNYGV